MLQHCTLHCCLPSDISLPIQHLKVCHAFLLHHHAYSLDRLGWSVAAICVSVYVQSAEALPMKADF